MAEMSKESLVTFAKWCHLNNPRFVYDPDMVERVYNAYLETDPFKPQPKPRKRHALRPRKKVRR